MIYEPERHEPLDQQPWDAARAIAAINAIAADAAAAFDPERLWPIHALDHTPLAKVPSYKSVYVGAAGVMWALHYLQSVGAVAEDTDWGNRLASVHRAYLDAPETMVPMPSYLVGESGILLVSWRVHPSDEAAKRLFEVVQENVTHAANELMLGTPGTMLAALFMYEWTSEERWRAAFTESADAVWSQWMYDTSDACWLWTQQFFGQVGVHLGAVHGALGNISPLLKGARWLPGERREELYRRCAEILERTAVTNDECANWPQSVGVHREGGTALLVQWCHGAPGIIGALRGMPIAQVPRLEALLRQGGELVWHAGPLIKGPGLCHGTAGNGYALLELYRRTGDTRWLERARAFAMHAIGQYEHMYQEHRTGRYSLWTGDVGLAVYLWHCIQGEGGFPSMDVL